MSYFLYKGNSTYVVSDLFVSIFSYNNLINKGISNITCHRLWADLKRLMIRVYNEISVRLKWLNNTESNKQC